MGVTIKDIAKVVGIASQNVSGVLSDNPHCRVSAANRERIREAAEKLGYCRNASARALRGADTRTVAILSSAKLAGIIDEHLHSIIMRLLGRLNQEGYACLFAEVCTPDAANLATLKNLLSRGVRNFIVFGAIYNREEILALLERNRCGCVLYNSQPECGVNCSMNAAVGELWRRLSPELRAAFKLVADPDDDARNSRAGAFRRATGGDFDRIYFPYRVVRGATADTEALCAENGYNSAAEVMRRFPGTRMIQFHNDHCLAGGIRYFFERGYVIGRDIHLICVNVSNLTRQSVFPLLTIRHPEAEIIDTICANLRQPSAGPQTLEMHLCRNQSAVRAGYFDGLPGDTEFVPPEKI